MTKAILFSDIRPDAVLSLSKDATANQVHVPTALGNDGRRRKARPFRAVIAEGHRVVPPVPAEKATWSVPLTVTKADPDQRLVFGWASVVTKDGKPVVDKQGDVIPVAELEKAAYEFVLYSRRQGDLHLRKGAGRCVESMAFTREKQQALGVDLGMEGWWVGFRVDDDALWAAHKRGERPEFSIGGVAIPVETT